jgi:formate dehydrogenase major subunit/formate dehydrogenase alpha subunit
MTNPFDDIVTNAQSMLIIGSNTTEQHPVFGAMIRQAVLQRKVKLVVADPRRIDITSPTIRSMGRCICAIAGTDIALINGLIVHHPRKRVGRSAVHR